MDLRRATVMIGVACCAAGNVCAAERYLESLVDDRVQMLVEQDGVRQRVDNGVVALRRAAFAFLFYTRGGDAILVNLCATPANQRSLREGLPLDSIAGLRERACVAELTGNPRQSAVVGPDRSNLWYREGRHRGRFDGVSEDGPVRILRRRVAMLDFGDSVVSLSAYHGDTLYVVMGVRQPLGGVQVERQRLSCVLAFAPAAQAAAGGLSRDTAGEQRFVLRLPGNAAGLSDCFVLTGSSGRRTTYRHRECLAQAQAQPDGSVHLVFGRLSPLLRYDLRVEHRDGKGYAMFQNISYTDLMAGKF